MTAPLRAPASRPLPGPGLRIVDGQQRGQRTPFATLLAPAVLTALVAAGAVAAQTPLRVLGDGPPIATELRLPLAYLVLAPVCGLLDALSLLSVRQHIAMIVTVLALYVVWRIAGAIGARRTARAFFVAELPAATGALAAVVALYAGLTLAPRPMAAIVVHDRDAVVVDFHSHTSASRDGRPDFDAAENRAWHRAAGFDVGYVSDHGTLAAAIGADAANPPRAGAGTMLLPALELRCEGEHLVLLGAPRAAADCDPRILANPGVVSILTIPGDLRSVHVLPRVQAIEVVDAAPRAIDQIARDGARIQTIAHDESLATIAGSNNHGWTHAAAAWSLVPISGWQALDARALDAAIRARVATGARSGIRVVERRRVAPPAARLALVLTVPAVAWQLLRDLSFGERLAWLAWIWLPWLVIRGAKRRRVRVVLPPARRPLAAAAVLAVLALPLRAQTLETETARLLPRGRVEIGAALEMQRGGGAPETAIPLLVGVGLADRWELTIEPVPYTTIGAAEGSPRATGVGDLEVTVTRRLADETRRRPALALAAEVKAPTARNALIGTGKTDYTLWAIASKRSGAVDTHVNVAYTVSGSPRGLKLNDTWTGAFALVVVPRPAVELFGEVMGVTAASPEGEGGDTAAPGVGMTVPPEVAGAQLVGTLGAGRWLAPGVLGFASLSYDNTRATLGRIGMTVRLR
ncbi:MAG TPA: hypothetical protein VHM30_12825 [Gemmatimonadaceae bacterium]|nr:hypothetical protein [Gemmatimonadaceae bacterium]